MKNLRADRSLNKSIITTDFDEFIKTKPDVILEVAGHQTIQKYAVEILRSGIDLLVTSVGAFTDDKLYDDCITTAENGARLISSLRGIGSLDTFCGRRRRFNIGSYDSSQRSFGLVWNSCGKTIRSIRLEVQPLYLKGHPGKEHALYPQM